MRCFLLAWTGVSPFPR